jgi:uncharacterized membrane protein
VLERSATTVVGDPSPGRPTALVPHSPRRNLATNVGKTIEVDVPYGRAYDQWMQFEQFPEFMVQ